MALPTMKTVPKTDLVDLSVLLYGQSKIGKSTWAAGADNAIFLACEAGLNSLDVYQVPITTCKKSTGWSKLSVACGELATQEHNFSTIVIDTIDLAYKFCTEHVCKKNGIKHPSDLDYGKGFGLVNNEFERFLTRLSHLPIGLILISHSVEREVMHKGIKRNKVIPTLPGKAAEIVMGLVDLILYAEVEEDFSDPDAVKENRIVRTKPGYNYEAGDRTGRLPDTLPLDFDCFVNALKGDRK